MKKLVMAMTLAFALGCIAQTSGSSTPSQGSNSGGAQAGSGSMPSNSGSSNSGSMQSGSSSSMSGDMNSDKKMKDMKTEKGCIRQSNGMYMLEEKGGKMVNLQSSQDHERWLFPERC